MTTRTSPLIHIALIVAIGLMLSGLVAAHATLQKTQPASGKTVSAAPTDIQLFFDEAVDLKVSKIALTGPSGPVMLGPTSAVNPKTLMAPITGKLADGIYNVNWQTAAADDGHVSKGAFKFTLKQAH